MSACTMFIAAHYANIMVLELAQYLYSDNREYTNGHLACPSGWGVYWFHPRTRWYKKYRGKGSWTLAASWY
jgi:hypothetical protein